MSSNGAIPVICATIGKRRRIQIEDVRALRKFVYHDAAIDRDEAEAIFDLAAANYPDCPEWRALFPEVMADWLVNQNEPEGFISEEKADWLVGRIGRSGRVASAAELEMLTMALEKARLAPPGLIRFAIAQIRQAVMSGDSPLREGAPTPGVIAPAEIDLLRRIIHAGGGDQSVGVSRDEAEMLLDINDALDPAENAAWDDLFVKAVANCVMAAAFVAPPDRAQALSRRAWLDSESGFDVGGFLSRMLGSAHLDMRDEGPDAFARLNARLDADIRQSEALTRGEADWLAVRLNRNGRIGANERKLLQFIARESPSIDPALQPLIDLAA